MTAMHLEFQVKPNDVRAMRNQGNGYGQAQR